MRIDEEKETKGVWMRITGGSARGRVIIGPRSTAVRPTASKLRQAFFNIIGNKIKGAHFLDLCAGTGLMGLEALSRGANSLTAVEENRSTAKTIEENLRKLDFEGEVICADLSKILKRLEAKFDVIYADPPYKSKIVQLLPSLISETKILQNSGILVIEHADSLDMPEQTNELTRYDQRKYGQTIISFYRYE